MTGATVAAPVSTPRGALHAATPSFIGIVRGELLKISRQWTTWIMALVVAAVATLPYAAYIVANRTTERIEQFPNIFLYQNLGVDSTILKAFGGALLIVVTARLIGMEYSGGTIRVLLARGVGRVQLLLAKLTAVSLVAVVLAVLGFLYPRLLNYLVLLVKVGDLDALTNAPATFWQDSWVVFLVDVLSFAATILMAAAVTVLTRSLAAGLTIGIVWFPVETFIPLFLLIAGTVFNNRDWLLPSGNILSLNLDAMPMAVLPERAAHVGDVTFTVPLIPVTGGHTLLVTAVWAAVFFTVAVVLTWLRDVKE